MGKKKETTPKTDRTSKIEKKIEKDLKAVKKTFSKEKPGKTKKTAAPKKANEKKDSVPKKAKGKSKLPLKKKGSLRKTASTKDVKFKGPKITKTHRKSPVTIKPKTTGKHETALRLPESLSVESSKFEMKPPEYEKDIPSLMPSQPRDLPLGYGDTKVVILVRDPEWIFAYWEINDKSRSEHGLLRGRHHKTLALRIFDVTDMEFTGTNAHRFYDIIINDYAVSWYLRMPEVNRSWCVDLGYYDTRQGNFITLARSNIVTTPSGAVSLKGDEEWMQIKGDQYEEILRLSGGIDIKDFRGSENLLRSISEKIKLQVERGQGASGGVTSGQMQKRNQDKDNFWLTVNTDIIVYGTTQAGAQVTIQGKKIPLRKDGSFSIYFSLPDGVQIIPVKAVNAKKDQECEITPKIIKETH